MSAERGRARTPIYFAGFSASLVSCECLVNDCPFGNTMECVTATGEQSINRWAHDGENAIELIVGPCEDEEDLRSGARAEVRLLVDETGGETEGTLLGRALLRRGDGPGGWEIAGEGAVTPLGLTPVGGKKTRARWSIFLDVPFGEQPWEKAPAVQDPRGIRSTLESAMRELWEILRRQDTQAALAFFHARDVDLARVYYVTEEEQVAMSRATIEQWWSLGEVGMRLMDFYDQGLAVRLYGHGRLAALVIPEILGSPVFYADEDISIVKFIFPYFYRDPFRGWIAIR